MKYGVSERIYGWFYHNSCKYEIKRNCKEQKINTKKIKKEYISIIRRAKDIGHSRLLSAYCMAAYFIALNNITTFTPEENYFDLAKYLCQLDFVMADMMGIELKRTQTIAEGAQYCDFRYSKK